MEGWNFVRIAGWGAVSSRKREFVCRAYVIPGRIFEKRTVAGIPSYCRSHAGTGFSLPAPGRRSYFVFSEAHDGFDFGEDEFPFSHPQVESGAVFGFLAVAEGDDAFERRVLAAENEADS